MATAYRCVQYLRVFFTACIFVHILLMVHFLGYNEQALGDSSQSGGVEIGSRKSRSNRSLLGARGASNGTNLLLLQRQNKKTHSNGLKASVKHCLSEKLVINQPSLCEINSETPQHPYLIIQVHSHPNNKPQRDAIRETWAKQLRMQNYEKEVARLVLVFLLGATNTSQEQSKIIHENFMYRDILQWDFIDDYMNLTTKSVLGLHWARTFCQNAKYIVKADDDLYMNITQLMNVIQYSGNSVKLLGSVYKGATAMRTGLWKVTSDQYHSTEYPPYCSGTAYAIAMEAAILLLRTHCSGAHPIIPVEDVYITGILAHASQLQCNHSEVFPNWVTSPTLTNVRRLISGEVLGLHGITYDVMHGIHEMLLKCTACATSDEDIREWLSWIRENQLPEEYQY